MANTANQMPGIRKSWTLLGFAKEHGKMQLGKFTNSETGEVFKSTIFTDSEGNRKFVHFSRNLGELSGSQIVAMKNELQVVELESGSFSLCKQGANSWEDIVL